MKRMRNEPRVSNPGNVGVLVLQGDRDNGESFFRASVKHTGTVLQQFRTSVCGPFRKDHNSHALRKAVTDCLTRGSAAVFALSVHPNGAKDGGTPADDGPGLGFVPGDVDDGKAHRKENGVDIGAVISHHDCRMFGQFTFPSDAHAHDALHSCHKRDEVLVNPRTFAVDGPRDQTAKSEADKQVQRSGHTEQQKKKDADEGAERTHAKKDVRQGTASAGLSKAEKRRGRGSVRSGQRCLPQRASFF